MTPVSTPRLRAVGYGTRGGVIYFGRTALRGADIWKWAIAYGLVFILVALSVIRR